MVSRRNYLIWSASGRKTGYRPRISSEGVLLLTALHRLSRTNGAAPAEKQLQFHQDTGCGRQGPHPARTMRHARRQPPATHGETRAA
jgi:hypothetical protein